MPGKHTKSCLQMQTCEQSGYVLLKGPASGQVDHTVAYALDDTLNTQAITGIASSALQVGVKLTINGYVAGHGALAMHECNLLPLASKK